MAHKLVGAIAIKWYKILGHIGPDAIKQLPKHINSVELEELINKRAPLKIEYEVCLLVKHTQQISQRREYKHLATRPFKRLAFNIITLRELGYNGNRYIMHFYYTYSKFNFIFTLRNKDKATILPTIRKTYQLIKYDSTKTLSSSGAMTNKLLDI
jgi:hypothetical protein